MVVFMCVLINIIVYSKKKKGMVVRIFILYLRIPRSYDPIPLKKRKEKEKKKKKKPRFV